MILLVGQDVVNLTRRLAPAFGAAVRALSGWRRLAGLLLLATYLVFAHGCHGDEDTELLVSAEMQQSSAGR